MGDVLALAPRHRRSVVPTPERIEIFPGVTLAVLRQRWAHQLGQDDRQPASTSAPQAPPA